MTKIPRLKPENFPGDLNERCGRVRSFIAAEGGHPAWGVDHSLRVYKQALRLAKEERMRVDEEVLFVAAMLHDVGAFDKFRKNGVDHSDSSIEFFRKNLRRFGFKPRDKKVARIVATMKRHMFYRPPGKSNEAVLLRDADILDFLGNTGIARLHSIIGKDDWTPTVEKADERLRNFCEELPRQLQTAAAKRIARRKIGEMTRFFNRSLAV